MKKLQLSLDSLTVETFHAEPARAGDGGTVQGYAGTLVGASCPAIVCQTYDDTLCGLTHGCE
jgi:hypothetical protein